MDSVNVMGGSFAESGVQQKVQVVVEKPNGFEKRSTFAILVMPLAGSLILWTMIKKGVYRLFGLGIPSTNSLWFDGLGKKSRELKDHQATWRALHIIYNQSEVDSIPGVAGFVDRFWWINTTNGRAVRNRLKIAKRELRKEILARPEQEVRVMSLAAGTAQGVIEVLTELKRDGKIVKSLLVDIDQTALDYAKNLAEKHGVGDQVETMQLNAMFAARAAKHFRPVIIEMMGLLDYLPQDQAVRLADSIRRCLPGGGVFITCNIYPNIERHFMKWVINWPMIYRTREHLADVAISAKFSRCTVFEEPIQLHGVLVARV